MFSKQLREARERRDEGFTLIELLIVIVVLGILAGIVVFGVSTFRADANTSACAATLKTVSVAADSFDAKTGKYPTAIADLLAGGGNLGYLKDTPVGTYTFNGTTHTVTQAGCPA
jgi:prepilin-type N-terminal cleavage/methylation domain-containing protein